MFLSRRWDLLLLETNNNAEGAQPKPEYIGIPNYSHMIFTAYANNQYTLKS